jgi:hypothetical protein
MNNKQSTIYNNNQQLTIGENPHNQKGKFDFSEMFLNFRFDNTTLFTVRTIVSVFIICIALTVSTCVFSHPPAPLLPTVTRRNLTPIDNSCVVSAINSNTNTNTHNTSVVSASNDKNSAGPMTAGIVDLAAAAVAAFMFFLFRCFQVAGSDKDESNGVPWYAAAAVAVRLAAVPLFFSMWHASISVDFFIMSMCAQILWLITLALSAPFANSGVSWFFCCAPALAHVVGAATATALAASLVPSNSVSVGIAAVAIVQLWHASAVIDAVLANAGLPVDLTHTYALSSARSCARVFRGSDTAAQIAAPSRLNGLIVSFASAGSLAVAIMLLCTPWMEIDSVRAAQTIRWLLVGSAFVLVVMLCCITSLRFARATTEQQCEYRPSAEWRQRLSLIAPSVALLFSLGLLFPVALAAETSVPLALATVCCASPICVLGTRYFVLHDFGREPLVVLWAVVTVALIASGCDAQLAAQMPVVAQGGSVAGIFLLGVLWSGGYGPMVVPFVPRDLSKKALLSNSIEN